MNLETIRRDLTDGAVVVAGRRTGMTWHGRRFEVNDPPLLWGVFREGRPLVGNAVATRTPGHSRLPGADSGHNTLAAFTLNGPHGSGSLRRSEKANPLFMRHNRSPLLLALALAVAALGTAAVASPAAPAGAKRTIVFVHGPASHGYGGITPILSAVPPASTCQGPDGPHSGNAHVRARRRMPEVVAWV